MRLGGVHGGRRGQRSEAADGMAQHLAEHLLVQGAIGERAGAAGVGALVDRGAGRVLGGHEADESHSR